MANEVVLEEIESIIEVLESNSNKEPLTGINKENLVNFIVSSLILCFENPTGHSKHEELKKTYSAYFNFIELTEILNNYRDSLKDVINSKNDSGFKNVFDELINQLKVYSVR